MFAKASPSHTQYRLRGDLNGKLNQLARIIKLSLCVLFKFCQAKTYVIPTTKACLHSFGDCFSFGWWRTSCMQPGQHFKYFESVCIPFFQNILVFIPEQNRIKYFIGKGSVKQSWYRTQTYKYNAKRAKYESWARPGDYIL